MHGASGCKTEPCIKMAALQEHVCGKQGLQSIHSNLLSYGTILCHIPSLIKKCSLPLHWKGSEP